MKRIGLIIPSSNRMVEQEMVRALAAGTTAHIARPRMTGAHHRPLEQLLPDVVVTAATLADARCDAIAFHCTANSTAGEAHLLDALGARRIVLITPYTAEVTAHEADFFRAAGDDVAATIARDLGGSDAYVLSCANIACFDVIERAEAVLGKPVVTSNQSVLWATLRAAAAPRPTHLGALMQRP
jgi:maleate isomerase